MRRRDPMELGRIARKDDKRDGYSPNGSVSIDSLAHDAFAAYIEDDVLRGTDAEWKLFFKSYAETYEAEKK